MKTQMNVRIDEQLKERFRELARSEGTSVSGKIRELVADYVKQRDARTYLNDLWERIGKQMEAEQIGEEAIEAAIREVRGDSA